MKPLTDPERRALHQASRKTGATIAKPFRKLDKGQVTKVTADKLIAAGYATLTNGFLRITPEGRHVLTIPVQDPPLLLTRRIGTKSGDYTTELHNSARDEPEPVHPTQTARWSSEATQNQADDQTEQWRRALKTIEGGMQHLAANVTRPDVRHELELMRRRADAIRRKLAA